MKNYIIAGIIVLLLYIAYLYRYYILWFFQTFIITLKNKKGIKDIQKEGMDRRNLSDESIKKYIELSLDALDRIGLSCDRIFILNQDLERHLRYSRFSEKYLKELLIEILKYMNLKEENLELEVHYISSKYFPQYAGLYIDKVQNVEKRKIVLNIQNDMTMDTVISVLAHECTHYLLLSSNIQIKDTKQNECLTDVTAIIVGFGKYMVEGYKISNKVVYDEINHRSIKKNRVGYLSYKDIEFVLKYIKKLKRKFVI